ncbi:glycosyltransferase family 25 protein [Sphingomonas sp.]|uniref:glycosyltransferase family 25 protein n=1 Tax=Sphingomonas sp. TaxID=28214 RepID=UPI0035C7FD59
MDRSLNRIFTQLPVPILVINLERDADRMVQTLEAFAHAENFRLTRSPGVVPGMPRTASQFLTRGKFVQAGTLGTFMAHVQAWETIAAGEEAAIVVEDDVRPAGLIRLLKAAIPSDCELLFINHRMADPHGDRDSLAVVPARTVLPHRLALGAARAAPGGDGYLLTPRGAKKLLRAVVRDGFEGHVDWRLLRYGISRADVEAAGAGTWMETHRALADGPDAPQWSVVTAYRMTHPLVRMRGALESSRKDISGIEQPARPPGDQAGG